MGALVLLLLACRPTDPTRSVSEPTDPTLTTPTSPIDSAPTSVTGLPATTAQTGTTASGTSTTGSTADTCPTAATAHTGNPHTDAPFTADTAADCPADPFTVAVGLGDTATACGDLPDDIPAPCVRQRRVEQTELSCVSTTGDTSATPACPTFDWALHAHSIYTQNVVAMDTLPDGDIVIVGQHQISFTVAQGRPDETTITQACGGLVENGYILRLRPDGTVVWGYPLVDSCEAAWVEGMRVTPQGHILTWGTHYGPPLSLRPDHPGALSIPATPETPSGSWEHERWWALVDADAAPLQLHAITAPGGAEHITDMDAAADGTVFAVGTDFDDALTLSAGTPDALVLPDDPDDDQPIWVAAWNPDGTPRWAKLEMRGPELLGNMATAIRAHEDHVFVQLQINSAGIFGHCEPNQTIANGGGYMPRGMMRLDAATGELAEPLRLRILPDMEQIVRDGDTWLVTGRVREGYEPIVLDGHQLEDAQAALYRLDSQGRPTGTIAASTAFNSTGLETIAVAADGYVLVGGPTWTSLGDPIQWQCGPVVGNGDGRMNRVTWHLFTPELEPVCGGTLGICDRYMDGTATVAFDAEGGVVVASTLEDSLTIERGTPNEQTFHSWTNDLLVVRYAR